MNIAISSPSVARPNGSVLRWLGTLAAGVCWGLEMRRRYDSERAAGRQPDPEAIRRMAGEVDGWLGRRI